jgi:uncharacterized membrane protein (UPF0127 family)
MRILILAVILSLFSNILFAQNALYYNKTTIKIVAAENVATINGVRILQNNNDKKAQDTKSSELMPAVIRVSKEFAISIRPITILDQQDFLVIEPFTDKDGMMILINESDKQELKSSNFMGKTDILFVSPTGIIEQIAPDIALADLDEPLKANKKIRAFIFLKSKMTEINDIRPGDKVESSIFKTNPVILE